MPKTGYSLHELYWWGAGVTRLQNGSLLICYVNIHISEGNKIIWLNVISQNVYNNNELKVLNLRVF